MPDGVRELERKIVEALRKSSLDAKFRITNYDEDTLTMEYELETSDHKSETLRKAKELVERYLKLWQSLYK